MRAQPGILQPIPRVGRYLYFSLKPGTDPRAALAALQPLADGESLLLGLGKSLLKLCQADSPFVPDFPVYSEAGIDIPSTPCALWCWLRGEDRGDLLHLGKKISRLLKPSFRIERVVDAFQYGSSLDLTGYEDGTENPQDEAAAEAALKQDAPLAGGSLVAVQQWVHDLDGFQSLSQTDCDHIIGRDMTSNDELDDAPKSAHVKRTAQEDYEPPAFVVRRSMPWCNDFTEGLMFVAFGHSSVAFEALLHRMVGLDDGITDALFRFTHPVTGNYFWCPPLNAEGQVDLSVLQDAQ